MVSAAPGNVRGQGVFGAFLPQRRVSWSWDGIGGSWERTWTRGIRRLPPPKEGIMGTYVDKGYSAPSSPKGGNHGMVSAAPGNVREEGVIAAFLPQRPKGGIMDGIGKSREPT
jgi:hypothetical protein